MATNRQRSRGRKDSCPKFRTIARTAYYLRIAKKQACKRLGRRNAFVNCAYVGRPSITSTPRKRCNPFSHDNSPHSQRKQSAWNTYRNVETFKSVDDSVDLDDDDDLVEENGIPDSGLYPDVSAISSYSLSRSMDLSSPPNTQSSTSTASRLPPGSGHANDDPLDIVEPDMLFVSSVQRKQFDILHQSMDELDNPECIRDRSQDLNVSEISVLHPAADDPKLGDDFGAKLVSMHYTFKEKDQWKHTFKDIQAESVASIIKLRANGDELVLMNNQFLPDLNNEEVTSKFRNLPVDGKTELTMVLRRKENGKRVWISISFVLSPDKESKVSGQPHEERLSTDPETAYRINLKMANGYLCVDGDRICIRKLKGQDDEDGKLFIMKQKFVDTDKPGYNFFAALEAPSPDRKYIGPDRYLNIKLLDKKYWYNYRTDGNDYCFIHKGKQGQKFYLARQEDKPVLVCTKFKCQVFPSSLKTIERDSGYNSPQSSFDSSM